MQQPRRDAIASLHSDNVLYPVSKLLWTQFSTSYDGTVTPHGTFVATAPLTDLLKFYESLLGEPGVMGDQYSFQGKLDGHGDSIAIIHPQPKGAVLPGIVYDCSSFRPFPGPTVDTR